MTRLSFLFFRIYFVLFFLYYLSPNSKAQTSSINHGISHKGKVKLRTLSVLPNLLGECSGILAVNNNRIWCINDSGNKPELYCIDTTGKIISSKNVKNAENIDWEDITTDGHNFFIGDFGNNLNSRKEFVIYKIPHPDSVSGESIEPEKLIYTYENLIVPVQADQLKYDAEAFIALNDSLYIFTKNRTKPFDGMLYIYALPIDTNVKVARKADSLFLGKGRMIDYWISSAALCHNKNHLALISYNKMWVFNLQKGRRFSQSEISYFDFEFSSQKESITFCKDDRIYITDERGLLFSKGGLYYLDLNLKHAK